MAAINFNFNSVKTISFVYIFMCKFETICMLKNPVLAGKKNKKYKPCQEITLPCCVKFVKIKNTNLAKK